MQASNSKQFGLEIKTLMELSRKTRGSMNLWQRILIESANVLPKWNKTDFGNIHHRKKHLLARIGGIQKSIMNNSRNGMLKLEKKLRTYLDEVLNQEELLWFKKSREELITSGDRNTKFYHASTMMRKSRSICYGFRDKDGEMITDEADVRVLVIN